MKNMKKISILLFVCFVCATLFMCCGNRRSNPGTDVKVDSVDYAKIKDSTIVNVYVENSGSMQGYVNGQTEFKGGIRELLVNLKNHFNADKIHLWFVNDTIYETQLLGGITELPDKMNPQSIKVGNTSWSKLDYVFKKVLSQVNTNTISVLFTDGIYSIDGLKSGSTVSAPRTLTKDAFWETSLKGNKSLYTTVVKISSLFNGIYYNAFNQKITYNAQRPYYIFMVGSGERIKFINSRIKWEKFDGYKAHYMLTPAIDYDVYYTVLKSNSNASFKASRGNSNKNYIHGIENVKKHKGESGESNFTFSIAMDLSSLSLDESYLLNKVNYKINDDYEIVGISPYTEAKSSLQKPDKEMIGDKTPTHVVTVRSLGSYPSLTLQIIKRTPLWVEETSVEDDSDIKNQQDQTFAFKHLVAGIEEAYSEISTADSYVTCTVAIEK